MSRMLPPVDMERGRLSKTTRLQRLDSSSGRHGREARLFRWPSQAAPVGGLWQRESFVRNTFLFAAAAGLIASTPIVQAETYTFASGSYDWGVTAPDPLLNPHVLELVTPADKTWDTKGMTNEGGTVSWKDGTLILKNGAPILNQKLWDAKADNLMRSDPSGTSTFTNEGVFRKSG
ncbi:MAG: hypothetical protein LC121_03760, partial [Anaerolineae bacterium]|nr:hypothetical protein [Anaerolineae bacterium]